MNRPPREPQRDRRAAAGRARLFASLGLLAGVLAGAPLSPPPAAAEFADAEVLQVLTTDQPRDKAIRRGLEYLRKSQRPDGAYGQPYATANSSLALMAHFAAGYTLEDQQYGEGLRRGVAAVLAHQDDDGYFGRHDGSNMYGHGIAALMLAEAVGMTRDDDLEEKMRRALERAVRVTINAALIRKRPGHEGGWRYQPTQEDSDLSLSGWQLMSLHAVQQVGVPVPEKIITAAVNYAKRLTTLDGKVGYASRGEDRPALRGLALLCFAIAGDLKAPEVTAVADKILADPIRWEGEYFSYRAYYDAVGMARAAPDHWQLYAARLEDVLLKHQQDDGSWDSPGPEVGRAGYVYVSSMAILALTVQRHVLPAYQR